MILYSYVAFLVSNYHAIKGYSQYLDKNRVQTTQTHARQRSL